MKIRRFPIAILWLGLNLCFAASPTVPFAVLTADPPSPYEGQPFTLTLSLYTSGEEFEPDLRLQGIPDAIPLQPFRSLPTILLPFEGRTYQTLRFQTEIFVPTSGEWLLNPWVEGTLVRTEQYLFLTRRSRYPIRIPVRPFQLVVRKIPIEKAPPGYEGLVGAFTLSASLSTNRFQPGDLLKITWHVRGVGRLDRLTSLGFPTADGFRVYPPRRIESESGVAWEQVLIPTNSTLTTIPPLILIAFNPFSERFETLAAGPFDITLDHDRPIKETPDPSTLLRELLGGTPALLPPVFITLPPSRLRNVPTPKATEARSLFASSVRAQEEGRYAEAWSTLLRLQPMFLPPPPELHANMGSALEGMGYPGRAVLWYLRALRKIPWHAPLRSRLRQIATRRNLLIPSLQPFPGILPLPFWLAVSVIGLFILLSTLLFLRHGFRTSLLIPLLITGLFLAGGGMWGSAWWSGGPPAHEAVVFSDQPVLLRLAPDPNSLVIGSLPPGSVVLKMDSRHDWCRVRLGETTGWIPAQTIETP